MPKRTPDQLWDAVHADAVDAEMDRVAKLGDADVDRELAEAGFDLDAVAADAAALRSRLASGEGAAPPPRAVTSLVDRRRRVVRWVALAAAVIACILLPLLLLPRLWGPRAPNIVRDDEPVPSSAMATETPAQRAERLRVAARVACMAQAWSNCLRDLDRAKALDPAGDADPDVQQLRKVALDGARHYSDKP